MQYLEIDSKCPKNARYPQPSAVVGFTLIKREVALPGWRFYLLTGIASPHAGPRPCVPPAIASSPCVPPAIASLRPPRQSFEPSHDFQRPHNVTPPPARTTFVIIIFELQKRPPRAGRVHSSPPPQTWWQTPSCTAQSSTTLNADMWPRDLGGPKSHRHNLQFPFFLLQDDKV